MDIKKLNNIYYSKLRKDKAKLWSFSAINTYENCPHDYWLSKIKKIPSEQNIYSKSGTLSHDMLEKYYDGELKSEDMYETFDKGMLQILTDGFKFPSEKIEQSYLSNMRGYFDLFQGDNRIKKCEEFVALPLWIYDRDLKDNYFQGWADAILEDEKGISIGDFKSSTIFKGQNLIEKSKQLILYAIAYEYIYGTKVHSIFFDFLKYANVTYKDVKGRIKTKTVERKDVYQIDNIQKIEKCYSFVELNDEIKQSTIDWFIKTMKKIQQDTTFNKTKDMGIGSFFCEQLCGQKKNCKYLEKIFENGSGI